MPQQMVIAWFLQLKEKDTKASSTDACSAKHRYSCSPETKNIGNERMQVERWCYNVVDALMPDKYSGRYRLSEFFE